MAVKTLESIVAQFPNVIKERYDFSEAIYTAALKPISNIKCPHHGMFSQYSAQLRKDGSGCPKCGGEKRVKSQRLSCHEFIEKVRGVHGDKYDYSKTKYVKMVQKVQVTCREHGDFTISPIKHFYGGQGCPECGAKLRGKRKGNKNVGAAAAKTSIAKHGALFEKKASVVHGNKYDYTEADYTGAKEKITVLCAKHGEFRTGAWDHINKGTGCPQCSHHLSKQEDALHAFCSIFTTAEQRNRSIIGPKEIDIYLPEHKLAIEYCGMYWHSHTDRDDERKNKRRHFEKHELCRKAGIRLITIFEADYLDHEAQIKRILRNAMGKSRGKLMARKCDVGKVGAGEARAFYNKYHPQGGTGNGEHYGLWWKEKLVACMRFTLGSNDRGVGAKERVWTLSRYATRVTVSGAASRLFKAFVREYAPEKIKSFSDNRYFSGAMYEQLGFDLESEVGPDYQVWSQKIGLRPKSHYQRRMLQTRLNDHGLDETFDANSDERAESELTYMMGARRIFDCGKKRWLWVQLIDK